MLTETNNNKMNIIFFAPLKNKIPSHDIGGAEMGCLKTLKIYEQSGTEVQLLPKPSKKAGVFSYVMGMFFVPFKLFLLLLKNKKSIVHIVGFYRNVVFLEWLLMQLSHLMGTPVIYEIRNGSMVDSFKKGHFLYKKLLKDLLLNPRIVLCQGEDYVRFIKEKWGVERTYYPNFLQDEFVPSQYRKRDDESVKIIYFGRVAESKNILLMLDVLKILLDNGLNSELVIIGASSADYKLKIDEKIEELGLSPYVKLLGRKSLKEIVEYLQISHYFLFPTNESQEGHSNSLTEAMGLGVVPIVSNKGFNASICGVQNLVIDDFEPTYYAEKIIEIEKTATWLSLSRFVQDRVKCNFTQSIVAAQLLNVIHKELT
jgi:glycosyltransferase involved in cell wall biosynthesis